MPRFFSIFLTSRFLRFCTVGLSGVGVNLGVLALMTQFAMHPMLASGLAIEISILSNFTANEFWTFKDRGIRGRRVSRLWQFQLVSLLGAVVQCSVFAVCYFSWAIVTNQLQLHEATEGVTDWYQTVATFMQSPPRLGLAMYVSQLLGIALATAWNFCANLLWTWQTDDSSQSLTRD